ncbi:hypothetical protein PHAVU_009G230100 [Phaseolus vulgaris]|uniref:Uncharacterized protein n=1 Tax=Phaseolus vulgaris TaxID=3885 RepID=V7AYI2_PHAVU|nr:hypothetical protein PHAVU_009G230100g [Phaseolus vulgaris]ESW10692.1 hypothetical protein PHAVU_009G230100g [Phaseolus vulgaris]
MHVPDSFLHQITEKFDDKNFLLWCQQVEPVIKAHQLHHFVVVSQVSLHFLTEQDTDLYQVNPEYLSREQDQMLLMRLQSSLSNANLSHLVGCVHSNELWEKIHAYFHHQSQKNARQLPSDLRNSSLHNCTLLLFFLILNPISFREHLDSILARLPQEYDYVIALIDGKIDSTTTEEVEDLSLAQELRLDNGLTS